MWAGTGPGSSSCVIDSVTFRLREITFQTSKAAASRIWHLRRSDPRAASPMVAKDAAICDSLDQAGAWKWACLPESAKASRNQHRTAAQLIARRAIPWHSAAAGGLLISHYSSGLFVFNGL